MVKRKREEDTNRSVDIGLGATLSHLRQHDEDSAITVAADDDGDGGGWTVVSASKKRQKRRNGSHGSVTARSSLSTLDSCQHQHISAQATGTASSPSVISHCQQPVDLRDPVLRNDSHLPGDPSASHPPAPGQSSDNMTREGRRKERKLQRNYPTIEHSHHARLQSHVKLADLQSLILYLLADGNAPQWVSVRSRASIQQVVMLMVPGLELAMFNGEIALEDTPSHELSKGASDSSHVGNKTCPTESVGSRCLKISPDEFYPAALRSDKLPDPLQPLAEIFDHVWPIKTPGEHRNNQYVRVHSPIHTLLTSQIPKTQEEKQMKRSGSHKGPMPQNATHWENKRTRVTEYIANLVEQQENDFVLHPAWFTTPESKAAALGQRKLAKQTVDNGWVDTNVDNLEQGQVPEEEIEQGSITAGRQVLSVDCEMCKSVDDELVLTRISLLDWDGNVVLDKLIKPDVVIKDYLTQWSGITPEMLHDVTTSLKDVQSELLSLVTPRTILVGHSLNSDLNALKLTHPFLVDTGILYPHPRGPPYKQSLKWLAQKFLRREVQKGTKGHDSVEDARTCLDLVKQKCEKGPRWGSGDTNAESIFKRMGRSMRPKSSGEYRSGAVVDWGDPTRGYGGQAQVCIGCRSDAQVVEAIERLLAGQDTIGEGPTGKVDFIWGRLRELELARGWWGDAKTADVEAIRQEALEKMNLHADENEPVGVKGSMLGDLVRRAADRIVDVYDSLPRCTAFIVYSGTGDPRQMRRLQAMQQQYRREYATKNWDNLSVKWTDVEVQALSKACQDARNGIALIAVK